MLLIISPSPASFRIRKNFPRNIFFTRRPSLLGAVLCVITQPLHRSFAWRHNEWLLRILGGPFFSRCLLFCGVRCSYSNKNQNNPASLFWLCRQCEILCAHFPAAIHAWTWALVSRPAPPAPRPPPPPPPPPLRDHGPWSPPPPPPPPPAFFVSSSALSHLPL